MIYVYQFDIAAIVLAVALLLLLFFRHGYPTRMHRLFIAMLVLNLVSSSTDLVSAFTISQPELYPLWFNYLINVVYASTYFAVAAVFFLYVLEAARDLFSARMFRMLRILGYVGLVLGVLLICTTPLTHGVFYFDENMAYCLGTFIALPYVIVFIGFFLMVALFARGRRAFEGFQRYVIGTFLVLELVAIFIEIAFPALLIGRFVAAMFLVFIYIVLENPTDYQYPSTRFYNRRAFENRAAELMSQDVAFSVVAFRIESYAYIRSVFDNESVRGFIDILYDFLRAHFWARNLFRLHSDICAVVTPSSHEEYAVNVLRGDGRKRLMLGGLNVDIAEAICVVRVPGFIESVDDLARVIDAELADTRTVLADRVVYAERSTLDELKHERRVSFAVQNAIDNLDIEVYYQPVYEFSTKRFCYAEALVRVRDKQFGAIPSSELIAAAEKNGAIIDLGRLVFSRVCRDIAAGRFNELGLGGVSVNLSMVECMQPDLADEVMRTLAAYGVRPDQVSFEITETVLADKASIVKQNIERLTEYGVRFSLDDFGSGFSSITYLMNMPVQNVKIGHLVVKRALEDKSYSSMLKKLIKVIRGMDKQVTIEGVETQEMVEYFAKTKADYCQGYYYSEPLVLRDFVALVREHNSLLELVNRVTDQAADQAADQASDASQAALVDVEAEDQATLVAVEIAEPEEHAKLAQPIEPGASVESAVPSEIAIVTEAAETANAVETADQAADAGEVTNA